MFLLLTLNVSVSLVFGYADYLVWLAEKSLDNLISGQRHAHWLKSFCVELKKCFIKIYLLIFNIDNNDAIIVLIISTTAAVVAAVSLLLEIKFWPEMQKQKRIKTTAAKAALNK